MKDDNSDDEDDNDDLEGDLDVLPDKANTVYTEAGAMSTSVKPIGLNIPKLDLAKAFKIQEINAKKSTIQQLQKQQGSDIGAVCSQLKKVEAELTIAKKNLQREMLLNKTLTIENENLKRFNVELESRNETLVTSHNMYEENWQKIFTAYYFYRDFYKKNQNQNQVNMQLQRSNRSSNNNRDKSILGIDILNSSSYITTINRYVSNNNMYATNNLNYTQNDSQINVDPDRILTSKLNSRKDFNHKGSEQKSILDINNNDVNLDEEIYKIDPLSQKEYAKNFLLNIAKDVYGMFNKQQRNSILPYQKKKDLSVIKGQNEFKLKRSLSNPLDYMNEHGKEMVIQKIGQNLDRSDLVLRNFNNLLGQESFQHQVQPQYKELNDVLSNQEILIQFTDQNIEDKIQNNLSITGNTPIKS